MSRDICCVAADSDVLTAAKMMKDKDIGFLPVCDGDKAIGTLTDRDITIRVVAEGKNVSAKVREFMTTDVVSCAADADVDEAARLMAQHEVSRVLICDDGGKPVGVISLGDLASQDEDDAGDTLAAVKEGVEQHP